MSRWLNTIDDALERAFLQPPTPPQRQQRRRVGDGRDGRGGGGDSDDGECAPGEAATASGGGDGSGQSLTTRRPPTTHTVQQRQRRQQQQQQQATWTMPSSGQVHHGQRRTGQQPPPPPFARTPPGRVVRRLVLPKRKLGGGEATTAAAASARNSGATGNDGDVGPERERRRTGGGEGGVMDDPRIDDAPATTPSDARAPGEGPTISPPPPLPSDADSVPIATVGDRGEESSTNRSDEKEAESMKIDGAAAVPGNDVAGGSREIDGVSTELGNDGADGPSLGEDEVRRRVRGPADRSAEDSSCRSRQSADSDGSAGPSDAKIPGIESTSRPPPRRGVDRSTDSAPTALEGPSTTRPPPPPPLPTPRPPPPSPPTPRISPPPTPRPPPPPPPSPPNDPNPASSSSTVEAPAAVGTSSPSAPTSDITGPAASSSGVEVPAAPAMATLQSCESANLDRSAGPSSISSDAKIPGIDSISQPPSRQEVDHSTDSASAALEEPTMTQPPPPPPPPPPTPRPLPPPPPSPPNDTNPASSSSTEKAPAVVGISLPSAPTSDGMGSAALSSSVEVPVAPAIATLQHPANRTDPSQAVTSATRVAASPPRPPVVMHLSGSVDGGRPDGVPPPPPLPPPPRPTAGREATGSAGSAEAPAPRRSRPETPTPPAPYAPPSSPFAATSVMGVVPHSPIRVTPKRHPPGKIVRRATKRPNRDYGAPGATTTAAAAEGTPRNDAEAESAQVGEALVPVHVPSLPLLPSLSSERRFELPSAVEEDLELSSEVPAAMGGRGDPQHPLRTSETDAGGGGQNHGAGDDGPGLTEAGNMQLTEAGAKPAPRGPVEYENEHYFDSDHEGGGGSEDGFSDTSSWSSASSNDEDDDAASVVPDASASTWRESIVSSDSFMSDMHRDDFAVDPREVNCHGVVHVRLIRAKNLPCAAGTLVQGVLALPPWKGRIRTEKVTSQRSKSKGVYVKWENTSTNASGGGPLSDSSTIASLRGQSCSMVHDYNNEDTPIPSITVDLMSSSSLVGTMFESFICSVKISCLPLMASPGGFIKKWFSAPKPTHLGSPGRSSSNIPLEDLVVPDRRSEDSYEGHPLILLELWFEPSQSRGGLHPLSPVAPQKATVSLGSSSSVSVSSFNEPTSLSSTTALQPVKEEDYDVTSAATSASRSTAPSHLFRIQSYWTPAYCAVCSSFLTAWRLQGYRCEACGLDCCVNCQLQVDVHLPCGSEIARKAVMESFQRKLSVKNIVATVAPVSGFATTQHEHVDGDATKLIQTATLDEGSDVPSQLTIISNGEEHTLSGNETSPRSGSAEKPPMKDGVGILRMKVNKALLFQRSYAPETDLRELQGLTDIASKKQGDHYVRISWTGGGNESVRTRTIHMTSKPNFGGEEIQFVVSHYGMEYRVEVIDANTDKPVGTTLLTAQGILQYQRDRLAIAEGLTLRSLFDARNAKVSPFTATLELRTGVKNGFGLDFFNASKSEEKAERSRSGEITGWIELDICLEEDMDLIYSDSPRTCPAKPREDLNVESIQLHIARIAGMIDDFKKMIELYQYAVSWKNPALTGLCMLIFVFACARFNVEYVGSLPVFFLILYMLHRGKIRRQGYFKMRWVGKERDARIEAEKKLTASCKIHRPIAQLKIMVSRGRNIRSTELGLPGSFNAAITWSPNHYMSEKTKESLAEYDAASLSSHSLGTTINAGVTTNPTWTTIKESEESYRLKQFLFDGQAQNPVKSLESVASQKDEIHDDPSGEVEQWDEDRCFTFPILQPIERANVLVGTQQNSPSTRSRDAVKLTPWEHSPGAIVVQIRFDNVFNKLLVFEDIIGEVVIPLTQLIEAVAAPGRCREVKGWFPLSPIGAGDSLFNGEIKAVKSDDVADESMNDLDSHEGHLPKSEEKETAEVYLCARLALPEENDEVSDAEREASVVVTEEMIRSISVAQNNKIGVIGSSINTISTVGGLWGNVQLIQNQLGDVLDIIEKIRNAFTWACPFKSAIIFALLLVVWLALCLIPTRLLVFVGGMAQFIVSFMVTFGFIGDTGESKDDTAVESADDKEASKENPIVVRLLNFLKALPTDEELRRTYFWEARRVGERERDHLAKKKRASRLKRLWRARWFGRLCMKRAGTQSNQSDGGRRWDWEDVFVVIQGHRLVWWRSEKNFDDGEAPVGYVLFAGHAGLAGLSPLDLRELGDDEVSRTTNVFGRGDAGQEKVAFLASNEAEKEGFENAVMEAAFLDDKTD